MRGTLMPIAFGASVIALGSSAVPATAQERPSGPAPGALVDIGGHKLHIRCVGPADRRPIVILEAGGGAFSSAWSQVQELLAPRVRTCAYDRAGSGWSEAGPAPRHHETGSVRAARARGSGQGVRPVRPRRPFHR